MSGRLAEAVNALISSFVARPDWQSPIGFFDLVDAV